MCVETVLEICVCECVLKLYLKYMCASTDKLYFKMCVEIVLEPPDQVLIQHRF